MKRSSLFNKLFLYCIAALFPFAGVRAQYCTPSFNQGCTYGTGIETFILNGESSTAINDPATGCSPPLSYYLDHTSMSVTLNQGVIYPVQANNNVPTIPFPLTGVKGVQIWIDFNNDFTFAATEIVGGFAPLVTTPALSSFSVSIPATATTGSHRMRVVASADFATYSLIPACPTALSVVHGEVHDYTVVIAGVSTPCSPVTGLAASAITSSSATISWTAVTGAAGYEWAVNTSATPPASGTATTLTSVNATGLTASTAYYAHVRTNCGTSYSTWVTIPFTTTGSTTTCSPVTGLTMSGITTSAATLNWTAVSGATGYEWAVNTSATPPASGTATALTTASATGLTAGTSYYAHVRTVCGTAYSTWVSVPFSTLSTGCAAITGLAASAITGTSATVSWTAVTSGSLGYQYVINNTVTAPAGSGTNTTLTSTSPTGLTAGTTYYAHVRDSCGVGSFSAWSTIPFTTLSSTCNAVTGLTVTGITSSGATLNWTMASGAVAAKYVVDLIPADPTIPGSLSATSPATVIGLSASTTYYAHVRDSCGPAALSAWVTVPFTTLASVGMPVLYGDEPFSLFAYPNPVMDILTIQAHGNAAGQAHLVLYDITGKELKTVSMNALTATMDMAGLPAGMYLVRYTDDVRTITTRVSKNP